MIEYSLENIEALDDIELLNAYWDARDQIVRFIRTIPATEATALDMGQFITLVKVEFGLRQEAKNRGMVVLTGWLREANDDTKG